MKAVLILIICFLTNIAWANRIKLTKVSCNVTDKSYCHFQTCRLKAVSRFRQFITFNLDLYQLPIKKASAHIRFLKRANGYKPFLYSFILDCDFIKHLNPLTRIVWTWFVDLSNLNHSCPLTENFEIKKLENAYLQNKLQALPIEHGDYAFDIHLYFNNRSAFNVQVYATIF